MLELSPFTKKDLRKNLPSTPSSLSRGLHNINQSQMLSPFSKNKTPIHNGGYSNLVSPLIFSGEI